MANCAAYLAKRNLCGTSKSRLMATLDGKKTGGRRAGTPNKNSHALRLDLLETLRAHGFDPAAELIAVYKDARTEYERAEEIHEAIQEKRADYKMIPLSDSSGSEYLRIAKDAAKELMRYTYPQLKAVELTGQGGADLFQSFADLARQVADGSKEST